MLPLRARVDLGAMKMKGVLHIPQSSSTAGTSPSDCLVSYAGHSLVGVLPLWRGTVGVFYSPSRLGKWGFVLFCFGLVSFFNGGLINVKAIFGEERQWYFSGLECYLRGRNPPLEPLCHGDIMVTTLPPDRLIDRQKCVCVCVCVKKYIN